MNERPLDLHDHWVPTPGGRLAVRTWTPAAAAPGLAPVLLFHDSLGCIDLWRSFPATLARAAGRKVIAYDRLGFGRSDPRTGPLAPDFIEDEARSFVPHLIAQLDLDRFVAFGHSVGGGMAAHCAARSGPACLALVMESAQFFLEDRTRAGILAAKARFGRPEVFGRLGRHHGDRSRWVLEAWTGTWLSPAFADWTLEPVLGQVRCPALVLHGSEDEYGTLQHPQGIVRALGGRAELAVIPGAGHVPHRDQEAGIAARVAGFLAAVGG